MMESRCLLVQEDVMALDPLSKILNAGLELAWAEHRREPLDEAELDALDLCDEIGAVRNIVAFEVLHGRSETTAEDPDHDGDDLGTYRT